MADDASAYRALPSVDRLLGEPEVALLARQAGRTLVREICRSEIEAARRRIAVGEPVPDAWLPRLRAALKDRLRPTLLPVINGTGVLIHTNLGRAPLGARALLAMRQVAEGYSNLEYDLEQGRRGGRERHAADRLTAVTGAEAALVVNNAAAALVLTLAALAAGREVVVSRSHLIEIGGGFRIPEILLQSGARLREVGTTNRTYLRDYVEGSQEAGALWLRLHASNFRIEGFTHQPTLPELSQAARSRGIPLVHDVGSGALLDTAAYGLHHEPMVQESLEGGADLVIFSGDKLLGGPQAGCIVGRASVIESLRHHPLARAFRVDKSTLAALDATLLAYQTERAVEEIPLWRMIARPLLELEADAWAWAAHLAGDGLPARVVEGHSTVGGGSLPGETLPTWTVVIPHDHPDAWAGRLRAHQPPVIGRIEQGALRIDPRTVQPHQEAPLLAALRTTYA